MTGALNRFSRINLTVQVALENSLPSVAQPVQSQSPEQEEQGQYDTLGT
jgi:hypothetical protein